MATTTTKMVGKEGSRKGRSGTRTNRGMRYDRRSGQNDGVEDGVALPDDRPVNERERDGSNAPKGGEIGRRFTVSERPTTIRHETRRVAEKYRLESETYINKTAVVVAVAVSDSARQCRESACIDRSIESPNPEQIKVRRSRICYE